MEKEVAGVEKEAAGVEEVDEVDELVTVGG